MSNTPYTDLGSWSGYIYASLLRYKLENLGIRAKVYDMKSINYRQYQQ